MNQSGHTQLLDHILRLSRRNYQLQIHQLISKYQPKLTSHHQIIQMFNSIDRNIDKSVKLMRTGLQLRNQHFRPPYLDVFYILTYTIYSHKRTQPQNSQLDQTSSLSNPSQQSPPLPPPPALRSSADMLDLNEGLSYDPSSVQEDRTMELVENTESVEQTMTASRSSTDMQNQLLENTITESVEHSMTASRQSSIIDLQDQMKPVLRGNSQLIHRLIFPALDKLRQYGFVHFLFQKVTPVNLKFSKTQRSTSPKQLALFFQNYKHKYPFREFQPWVYLFAIKNYPYFTTDLDLQLHIMAELNRPWEQNNTFKDRLFQQHRNLLAKLDHKYLLQMGNQHSNAGRIPQAYYYYKLGWSINPSDKLLRYKSADMLRRMCQQDNAESIFSQLLKEIKQTSQQQYLLQHGLKAQHMKFYDIKLSIQIHMRLAQIKTKQGKHEEAEQMLKIAKKLLDFIARNFEVPSQAFQITTQSQGQVQLPMNIIDDSKILAQIELYLADNFFSAANYQKTLEILTYEYSKARSQREEIPEFIVALARLYTHISPNSQQSKIFARKMVDRFTVNLNEIDPLLYVGVLKQIRKVNLQDEHNLGLNHLLESVTESITRSADDNQGLNQLLENVTESIKRRADDMMKFAEQLDEEGEKQTSLIIRKYLLNHLSQYVDQCKLQQKIEEYLRKKEISKVIDGIEGYSLEELQQKIIYLKNFGLYQTYIKEIGCAFIKYDDNFAYNLLKQGLEASPHQNFMQSFLKLLPKTSQIQDRQSKHGQSRQAMAQSVLKFVQGYLGDIYLKTNELDKAIGCYQKCITLNHSQQSKNPEPIVIQLIQCYELVYQRSDSSGYLFTDLIINLTTYELLRLNNYLQKTQYQIKLLRKKYNALKNRIRATQACHFNQNYINPPSINQEDFEQDCRETLETLVGLDGKYSEYLDWANLCLKDGKMQEVKNCLKYLIEHNIQHGEFHQFLNKLCQYHHVESNSQQIISLINELCQNDQVSIKKEKMMALNYYFEDYKQTICSFQSLVVSAKSKKSKGKGQLIKISNQFINLKKRDSPIYVFLLAIVEGERNPGKFHQTLKEKLQDRKITNQEQWVLDLTAVMQSLSMAKQDGSLVYKRFLELQTAQTTA